MSKIAVLIVAGGSGLRMDSDVPKQYLQINGQPILRHTLNKFNNFDLIQCVIGMGHQPFYQQAVDGLNILDPIVGGKTRQDSVYIGLQALKVHSPDYVIIHDAARPIIYPHDIHNIINVLGKNVNATLACPISESLQRDGINIDRNNLWMIQTPQAFDFDMIVNAHEKATTDNFIGTDDTSVAKHLGFDIQYITCGRHNIKITTQDDLKMARMILCPETETKVGNGFDVHAFDTCDAKMIRLCGVDIPHDRQLRGHSDADVGLHALTDAILGALGEPDIGQLFPPNDDQYKNMDSHVFLDKSVDILRTRGGSLTHIDITFMCEEPKIGKHREAIIDHLSNHLKLSTSRISVKATTTEKLGFTGRGEGIACQAVVTIKVPAHD